jgi:hypothetical protein
VYFQNLRTTTVHRLSKWVEPRALLDGQTVIIAESCHLAGPTYAVNLGDLPKDGRSE